jgi:hypothetical protein
MTSAMCNKKCEIEMIKIYGNAANKFGQLLFCSNLLFRMLLQVFEYVARVGYIHIKTFGDFCYSPINT